jgi:superfamily II DNA/RNA helicase
MIEELANTIWDRKKFHKEYSDFISFSLKRSIGLTASRPDNLENGGIKRLLESAAIFASDGSEPMRQAAYRIAVNSWLHFRDEFDNIAEPASLILNRLGNFPTESLLEDLEGPSPKESRHSGKTFPLLVEQQWRREKNTVDIGSKRLPLTDFQHALWNDLTKGRSLAVNAPTSAGKSFVLSNFLAKRTKQSESISAIYTVPTRALINQVSSDIKEAIIEYDIDDALITSIPIGKDDFDKDRVIYVLTQERLTTLLDETDNLKPDLLIADEAHSIQDGSRGVVFEDSIRNVLDNSPETQIIFSTPLTENVETFGEIFDIKDFFAITTSDSPVAQNLFLVNKLSGRQKTYDISTIVDDERHDLGEYKVETTKSTNPRKLSNIAYEIGRGDPSLVYYGAPSQCESIASSISERINDKDDNSTLESFSEIIQDHVHPSYSLAQTIKNGVAYHYGNMPNPIRRQIESLFRSGEIDFLVATSTLLHGVNLPAKNLFLRKPTKGDYEALNSVEFWNLAGRAGRLNRDFQGNIFLVDLNEWDQDPLKGPNKQTVRSATSDYLGAESGGEDLLEFINRDSHAAGSNQGLENVFSRMVLAQASNDLDNFLSQHAEDVGDERISDLRNAVQEAENNITLPREILESNKNISPYRQQELFANLKEQAKFLGPEFLVPPHPKDSNSYNRISSIFRSLRLTLKNDDSERYKYHTAIAMQWMTGDTYRSIIDESISHSDNDEDTVVRNTLKMINNTIRYEYFKLVKCYNSMVEHLIRGREDIEPDLPNIPLFLQVGACDKTMINLIRMGVSRMTASMLTDYVPSEDMDRDRVVRWLEETRISDLGLPSVCESELIAASY